MDFSEVGPDVVERIGEIDRTESIGHVYDCVPASDGRGLTLQPRRLDEPWLYLWTPNGLLARIEQPQGQQTELSRHW